jgi:hypothetical protein
LLLLSFIPFVPLTSFFLSSVFISHFISMTLSIKKEFSRSTLWYKFKIFIRKNVLQNNVVTWEQQWHVPLMRTLRVFVAFPRRRRLSFCKRKQTSNRPFYNVDRYEQVNQVYRALEGDIPAYVR